MEQIWWTQPGRSILQQPCLEVSICSILELCILKDVLSRINVRLEGVNCMIDSPFTRDLLHNSMVIGKSSFYVQVELLFDKSGL